MKTFLSALAFLARRAPVATLLFCVALLAIALVAAFRKLRLQTDVTELLPKNSELARQTREAMGDFGAFEFMLAVLETNEPEGEAFLIEASHEVAEALNDQRFFSSVQYRLDPRAYSLADEAGEGDPALLINLMTSADWDAIEALMAPEAARRSLAALHARLQQPLSESRRRALLQDPFGWNQILRNRLTYTSGPAQLNVRNGYFLSEDGRMMLMILRPVEPATNLIFAQGLDQFLRETREGLWRRNPGWRARLSLEFAGPHRDATLNVTTIRHDFSLTLTVSFLAIIVLFWLSTRRLDALYFISVPLFFGVVWTLGLTAGTLQRITIVTAAMGGVLAGLGVDYGILLYNRIAEEIQRGASPPDAVTAALQRTGRGIVTGGLAAAAGFFGMTLGSFEGFRELGLVAGIGILCCMMAALLMIPSMALLLLGRRAASYRKRPLLTLGLPQLAEMTLARPRTTLVSAIVVTAFLGYTAQQTQFDSSLRDLQQTSEEYERLRQRIDAHFQTPSNQIIAIVEGPTLQDALEANDLLYRNLQSWQQRAAERVLAVDSLRPFLPSIRTQRASQQRLLAFMRHDWPQTRERLLQAAQEVGLAPAALDPFFERIERLRATAEQGRILEFGFGALPSRFLENLVQRYVTKRGDRYRVLTQIYPPKGQWETEIPESFLTSLQLGDPSAGKPRLEVSITGVVTLTSQLRALVVRDLALTCFLVILLLLIILFLHFRNVRDTFLTLLPVGVALFWTLGVWSLLGLKINFLNIVALPMILGIGVHSGLHLLERYHEMQGKRLKLIIETTGRGVFLTSLTTMAGFGSLTLAEFRGLQQIGLLTLVGVGANLIATLVILPVALHMIKRGLTFDDWTPQDLG